MALTALLLLLVMVMAAAFLWQGQKDALAAAETRASSAAFTAAAHVHWLIEANRQALRRLDEALGDEPDLRARGALRDVDASVASLPGTVQIWVFDADGRAVLADEPIATADGSVADREYFQALRDGAPWHIGPLLTERRSGHKVFTIAHRIERRGVFLGAAVIYVPAHLMAQFWASMNLGAHSTVGLLRDDGWLVARFPVPEATINLANYVLFTEHLPRAPQGTYHAGASPADGISRVVGYRRVDDLPLVAVVGVATGDVAEAFWQRARAIGLVVAPIALALVVGSAWVVRLLHQEEQARTELAQALERNRTLLREIHHRVKNNLQTVASLVQLQPGPAEQKEDVIRRIAAMTAVHEHMYRSDRFGRLDAADYIGKIAAGLQASHGGTAMVECRLAPIEISPDQALPLGLIVNEVVSNAFKHAFADGRGGSILVTLEQPSPGEAVLRVKDDGIGQAPDRHEGMGSRLIRGLSQQIGGTYALESDGGTLFVLTFPLPAAAADHEGETESREPHRPVVGPSMPTEA